MHDIKGHQFVTKIFIQKVYFDFQVFKAPFFPASIIRPLKNEIFGIVRIVSCLFDSFNLVCIRI